MLLAYYIAAVNIESAYHYRTGAEYQPFPNILLTDSFQLNEIRGNIKTGEENPFLKNSQRLEKQNKTPIQVILGNPPYSAGQRSENDANKNLKYFNLDNRITDTYVLHSNAQQQKSLKDSYIRSLRWASDRISGDGIVAFVTSASYLDAQAMDGVRKCLADDFSSIYCFNLRGNARTSGEQRRKEKGNVFGEGTRTPIVVTLFIKKTAKQGACKIHYYDIGDYLNREQKLQKIRTTQSYKNLDFSIIQPNQHHDWLNQRSETFQGYFSLGDPARKRKSTPKTESSSIFESYSNGVVTNRDAWVYNFDRDALAQNMQNTIDFYNQQVKDYEAQKGEKSVEEFIDNNPQKISWDRTLKKYLKRSEFGKFGNAKMRKVVYRPFQKQWLYFDKQFNSELYRQIYFFPKPETKNLAICVSGTGSQKDFSAFIVDCVPDLNLLNAGGHVNAFLFILTRAENLSRKQEIFLLVNKRKSKKQKISPKKPC